MHPVFIFSIPSQEKTHKKAHMDKLKQQKYFSIELRMLFGTNSHEHTVEKLEHFTSQKS